MKLETKTGALIIVAVAVLVIIFIAAFVVKNPGFPQTGQQPGKRAGVSPTYAPKGALVAGFPKELILDAAAQVSNSYSINYSASLNQYTAQWSSSSSMATLYAAYKKYFTDYRWTITNDFTARSTTRGVAATNGSRTANVAIVAQGEGSQVTISYLAK